MTTTKSFPHRRGTPSASVTVTRRFSDFLGMHEKLVEKHSHLGRIIPPAPEKNLVGTTKAKFQGGGDAGGAVNGSNSRYSHNSFCTLAARKYLSSWNTFLNSYEHLNNFLIDGIATVPIAAAQPILTTHPIRPTQNSSIKGGWPLKGLQIESSVIPYSEKVQFWISPQNL